MEPELTTPGKRLKAAIRESGRTQADVARCYGSKPQYLTEVVRGRCHVSQDLAAWLQREMNINLNWLFTGKGPHFLTHEEAERARESAGTYEAASDEHLLSELAYRIRGRSRLQDEIHKAVSRIESLEKQGELPPQTD